MDTNACFVCWDGDAVGRKVGRAVLNDRPEDLASMSVAIKAGNKVFCDFALRSQGSTLESGGDEGVIIVQADRLGELPKLMSAYEQVTGCTVSVGIGPRLSQAGKARLVAKLRGGDQACVWDDAMDEELEQLQPEEEGDKLADAYGAAVSKAEPAAIAPDTSQGANGQPGTPAPSPADRVPAHVVALQVEATMPAADVQTAVSPEAVDQALAAPQVPSGPTLQDRVRELAAARLEQDRAKLDGDATAADALRQRLAKILQGVQDQPGTLQALVEQHPGMADTLADLISAVRDLARVVPRGRPAGTPPAEALAKGAVTTGSERGREHVERPVGAVVEHHGTVKLRHPDEAMEGTPAGGKEGFRQVRSGMVRGPDGQPASAREPNVGESVLHPQVG